MLRPQVFALQEGEVSIGLICSEKQAIDATLASLAAEDPRFTPVADIYWNARGGSHTDGGAFLMTVSPADGHGGADCQSALQNGHYRLRVTNKFGVPVATVPWQVHCNLSVLPAAPQENGEDTAAIQRCVQEEEPHGFLSHLVERLPDMEYDRLRGFVDGWACQTAKSVPALGIEALTLAIDRRYPTGGKKRSSLLTILRGGARLVVRSGRRPPQGGPRRSVHCGIGSEGVMGRVASSWLMKARSSGPVMPCWLAAQSRQR